MRRQRLTGPAIARAPGMARPTVSLVLRRLGLNRMALLEPRPPVIRYERERPGEMLHLDIKSLGRFERIGHRISGDRTGQSKSRGIGWDHLHVAIDDASRLAYTKILPSLGREDATAFLTRALHWFARLGVRVERVMIDNGSAYRSKLFVSALQQAGIRHVRTRPYTPRTNGKAERFIQTSLREWAYAGPYPTSAARNMAIGPWTDAYNTIRPHAGIAGASPFQSLTNLLGKRQLAVDICERDGQYARNALKQYHAGKGLQSARMVPTDGYEPWEISELQAVMALVAAERAKGATFSRLLRRCQHAIR